MHGATIKKGVFLFCHGEQLTYYECEEKPGIANLSCRSNVHFTAEEKELLNLRFLKCGFALRNSLTYNTLEIKLRIL